MNASVNEKLIDVRQEIVQLDQKVIRRFWSEIVKSRDESGSRSVGHSNMKKFSTMRMERVQNISDVIVYPTVVALVMKDMFGYMVKEPM